MLRNRIKASVSGGLSVTIRRHRRTRADPPCTRPRDLAYNRAMTNRQATRFLHTGSKRWRLIRERVLVRDLYRCNACGRYGNHVDHIDSNTANNHLDNLQTLCQPCHAVKTAIEQVGGKWEPKGCDTDGTPFGGHWAREKGDD